MMSPIGIIEAGYDMDSGYVYAKFITGDIVLIDCDEVEKTYANNMYERSELDCLICNDCKFRKNGTSVSDDRNAHFV